MTLMICYNFPKKKQYENFIPTQSNSVGGEIMTNKSNSSMKMQVPGAKQAIDKMKGAYALGVIHKDDPERIIAARKDSPLIVGIGQEENFVASDITALLKYTKKYYE